MNASGRSSRSWPTPLNAGTSRGSSLSLPRTPTPRHPVHGASSVSGSRRSSPPSSRQEGEMSNPPTVDATVNTDADLDLRQLRDRMEISDLVYQLGVCLDEGHFDALRLILVQDVLVGTPGGRV